MLPPDIRGGRSPAPPSSLRLDQWAAWKASTTVLAMRPRSETCEQAAAIRAWARQNDHAADEHSERVAQLRCVVVGQVDLVGLAVEPEGHGAGRIGSTKVVDELHIHLLRYAFFRSNLW